MDNGFYSFPGILFLKLLANLPLVIVVGWLDEWWLCALTYLLKVNVFRDLEEIMSSGS